LMFFFANARASWVGLHDVTKSTKQLTAVALGTP
jgi:hypothetical protein